MMFPQLLFEFFFHQGVSVKQPANLGFCCLMIFVLLGVAIYGLFLYSKYF